MSIEILEDATEAAKERLESAGERARANPDCPDADAELWEAFEALEAHQDALRMAKHGYRKTYPHPGPALYNG